MNEALAPASRHVLTLEAASARGQVAAITALLEQHGAYVEELSIFDDDLSHRFYLRCVFRAVDPLSTSRTRGHLLFGRACTRLADGVKN
jgi:formyltetrahydrofolate deformylase